MKTIFSSLLLCISFIASAQHIILINNVEIFNGKDEKTITGNILIEDNLIKKIDVNPIATNRSANTLIIDGKGKFLMPGLIDAHVHTMVESLPLQEAMNSDFSYITLRAANAAEKQLMRGFTTVRDLAGGSFGLKKAIDEGYTKGPRIYPSGAGISQTGGHGDFALATDVPRQIGGPLNYMEKNNMFIVADGADQVLLRTREQLRNGATQIKLMGGGGVTSNYDPLDVTQYTDAEFKAAVSAAENWGTYVTVHAYTPRAIQIAINAGVKCIEHGQLADEETVKLMAQKGIWWSLQPFDDDHATPLPEGSANRAKQLAMFAGTDNAYRLAKKYHVKVAWGTDVLFDAELAAKQGEQLAKMTKWYSPFEILKMATSTNAELLALSGPRNPYQKGKLGVLEEGAYADMILVDGNPIQDIKLVEDPERNFLIIMKDGIIYKNTLSNQ